MYSLTVIRVSGPNSLILDDGSEVVLSGILMPTALDVPVQTETWQPEHDAARALGKLVAGQSLQFIAIDRWRDRYGRRRVHAFLSRNNKRIWIQSQLVARGLARVIVEDLSDLCASALLNKEREARVKRLGLWQHAAYALRRADRPWQLLRYRGSYQIVEGTIIEVAKLRSRTFMNFGQNRRKDFTAGVFGRRSHNARVEGLPLTALKGRRVVIRGWISWRGGPFIQLKSMTQISLAPPQHAAKKPAGAQLKKKSSLEAPDQDP